MIDNNEDEDIRRVIIDYLIERRDVIIKNVHRYTYHIFKINSIRFDITTLNNTYPGFLGYQSLMFLFDPTHDIDRYRINIVPVNNKHNMRSTIRIEFGSDDYTLLTEAYLYDSINSGDGVSNLFKILLINTM